MHEILVRLHIRLVLLFLVILYAPRLKLLKFLLKELEVVKSEAGHNNEAAEV